MRGASSRQGQGRWLLATAIILLLSALGVAFAQARAASTSLYDDALASGWQNWSWDATVDLANAAPVHGGANSIAVQYTKAWGGLYLHNDAGAPVEGATLLLFWLNGGAAGGQRISIKVNGIDTGVTVTATANTWTAKVIPLADLGSPTSVKDIYWQDAGGGAQPVFYLDNVTLESLIIEPDPTEPPPPSLQLTVDAAAQRHAISPYIYGMNFAGEALAAELALPVNRWGGNATTRYNYQTDVSNQASDWYFQNIKQSDATDLPADSAANRFIEQNTRTGTATLLTLPMSGYVANNVHKACGFDVRTFGPQQQVDPYEPHYCGNGVYPNGALITGNDPSATSIAAGPSFSAGWVNFLKGKYGAAVAGGVRFYDLDNEPDIWYETHRDIRPTGWRKQEFLDATVAYATAVKAADPAAQLLGPVVNGWTYYFYSAYDGQQQNWANPVDGKDFVAWYLQQLKAKEPTTGRLLDYLDLHYYPQAAGVALATAGNAATQALRLRSTRSLWDPGYADESWIGSAGPDGGIVRLLPRMREWVNQNYPGTKLAISEYNWGGLESINGALAQADVLGIFGREGLDLATLWDPPAADQPGALAFRLYRNYDGAGSQFGDVGVQATSSDQGKVAVHAAQRSSDGAVTVLVINKQDTEATVPLSIANAGIVGPAAVYRYSPADLTRIVRTADQPQGSATLTLPAQSITLLVYPTAAREVNNWLYLPFAQR